MGEEGVVGGAFDLSVWSLPWVNFEAERPGWNIDILHFVFRTGEISKEKILWNTFGVTPTHFSPENSKNKLDRRWLSSCCGLEMTRRKSHINKCVHRHATDKKSLLTCNTLLSFLTVFSLLIAFVFISKWKQFKAQPFKIHKDKDVWWDRQREIRVRIGYAASNQVCDTHELLSKVKSVLLKLNWALLTLTPDRIYQGQQRWCWDEASVWKAQPSVFSTCHVFYTPCKNRQSGVFFVKTYPCNRPHACECQLKETDTWSSRKMAVEICPLRAYVCKGKETRLEKAEDVCLRG